MVRYKKKKQEEKNFCVCMWGGNHFNVLSLMFGIFHVMLCYQLNESQTGKY